MDYALLTIEEEEDKKLFKSKKIKISKIQDTPYLSLSYTRRAIKTQKMEQPNGLTTDVLLQ
jgi:hypothetical protein